MFPISIIYIGHLRDPDTADQIRMVYMMSDYKIALETTVFAQVPPNNPQKVFH